MWTAEQRARHKVVERKDRRGYPSDISDQEWKLVEPLLPGKARTGRPRKVNLCEVINALRYLVRSGCEWRILPNAFPPHQTVYYWFHHLIRRFLFRKIHDLALMLDRMCEQREVVPSTTGIVDGQWVKGPDAHERGYDAHKNVIGREWHIAVDTDGRLPISLTRLASGWHLLDALVKRWSWVKHLFDDAAYDRHTLLDKAASPTSLSRLCEAYKGRPASRYSRGDGRRTYVGMPDALSSPVPRLRAAP